MSSPAPPELSSESSGRLQPVPRTVAYPSLAQGGVAEDGEEVAAAGRRGAVAGWWRWRPLAGGRAGWVVRAAGQVVGDAADPQPYRLRRQHEGHRPRVAEADRDRVAERVPVLVGEGQVGDGLRGVGRVVGDADRGVEPPPVAGAAHGPLGVPTAAGRRQAADLDAVRV